MPFTPFHMGPAALFKLASISYFSFTVYGYSQVLMDLGPLYRLIREDDVIHGHSHTYVGALGIGTIATLSGKYICEFGLRSWNVLFRQRIFKVPTQISWYIVFVSAYIGTFSHVLLDSMMHIDMKPLWPFSDSNGLLYWLSTSHLHMQCLLAGLIGGVGLMVNWLWIKVLKCS